MELLMTLKYSFNRGPQLATFLIYFRETCLLGVLIVSYFGSFYQSVFQSIVITPPYSTNLVNAFLAFNLVITALTLLGLATNNRILKLVWVFDAYFLKLFTYLVMVPIITFSVGAAQVQQFLTRIASIINIIFAIAYVLIHGYLNQSLRFIQIDFCNRKAIYFVQKLLIAAGIITVELFGPFMGSFFYLLRSIFIAGQLYNNYQYQNVQRVQIFYVLITSFISLMVITGNSGLVGTQKVMSIASSLFLFILGGVVSWILSQQLRIQNNQRLLAKTQWGGERGDGDSTSNKQENNITSFQNQLRILVQVILQKNKFKENLPNDYDQYWKIFNERVFQHRLKCDQKHCICHSKKLLQSQMDEQIYISDLFKILRRAGTILGKQGRLKVLNIGLLIEIAKKPLKGYYELMSVKKDRHQLLLKLQMQELVVRARECFEQIYYKNKVQNQQLNLSRVIQCEQIMDSLQQELRTIINLNISFLQLFTSSTVKIGQVLAQSKKLFQSKHSIETNLQKMIWQLGESRGVGLAMFVFYRMINPYKSRENQFKKIGGQQVLKKRMMQKASGEEISQDQGVIYIDLVQERGRIKKITRNIAEFFGYGKEEMVGFNINLFMPSMYGKYHAQFLSNFIDKGRIKLLKQRARIVFAKNKRKFIFPINIKLKTQHLQQDQFGASALITKIDTSSEFFIAGNQARIQEITEGAYKKFFGGILNLDVGRLNKLCLYKMILGLNQINQNWQQKQSSKIHEGLFIFAQKQDYLFEKFRYNREATYSSISNRAKTLSLSATSISSNSGNIISKSQRYQYFAELFRNFFIDINPKKLRGFKISYKYSRVSTASFQLQTIEIVNIKDEIFGRQFQRELLNEINNVAEIYQLLQEHSPLSRYFCQLQQEAERINDSIVSKEFRLNMQLDKLKYNQNKTLKDFSSRLDEVTQSFEQDISNNKKMFNPQNSEQSSLIGSTQTQSKRQLLINALNNYQSAIPMPTICLANLCLLVLLVLLGLCSFFSYNKISKANQLWNDGTFILDIKTFIQFRISFIELETYSQTMNITMAKELVSQKDQLNSQISSLVQKINQLVLELQPAGPYSAKLKLYDPIRHIIYDATLPEVFTQLLWLFQKSNTHSIQFIRVNYQVIHLGISNFYNQKKIDLERENENSYQIIKYIFSFYEGLLGLAALCSLPLFIYFKREENNVRSKLAFMSLKQIKKAIARFKITHDFLRETLKKSAITRLQAQLQQKKGEKQQEAMNINRFIKVTTQQQQKKVFKDPKLYALLLAFIIFFSNLSISLFVLSNNAQNNFLQAVHSFQLVNNLQIKAPLLTNIYLANINNFIQKKPTTNFSSALANQAQDGYFRLIQFLSKPYSSSNALAADIKRKITDPICSYIKCQDMTENLSLLYLLNSLKKRFDYWSTKNGISISEQSLQIWLQQYHMGDTLKDMQNIIDLTFIIRTLVQSQFSDWISFQKTLICIIVGIFIPLNTILLILITQSFLNMLNGLVKSAQQIYQHFPPSVLVQNTYLTSYFNSKLKHGK